MRDRDDFSERVAPVREGEEFEVEIEAVGSKGDGIAKREGFVIFVPNTKKGDRVTIRVTRVLNNMAFSEVVGTVASEEREQSEEESGSEEGDSEEPSGPEEQPVDSEDFGEEEEDK